jgi:hypothetical protein
VTIATVGHSASILHFRRASDGKRRVFERLGDVSQLKVWVFSENFFVRHPVAQHRYDCGNGKPHAPNAWHATHPFWISGDALECHGFNRIGGRDSRWANSTRLGTGHQPLLSGRDSNRFWQRRPSDVVPRSPAAIP